jgi:hypothetical protein
MGVGGSAVSVVYVDELEKRLEERLQLKYERGMRRVLPSLTSSLGIFVALQQIAVGMGKVMSATIAECESVSGGLFGFGSWRTQALNCGAAPTTRSRAAPRIRVTDREFVCGDEHRESLSVSGRLTRALRSGGCVRACVRRRVIRPGVKEASIVACRNAVDSIVVTVELLGRDFPGCMDYHSLLAIVNAMRDAAEILSSSLKIISAEGKVAKWIGTSSQKVL